jgi:GNAT superfamily N-acetyltransferase
VAGDLEADAADLRFRRAVADDVAAIVALLAEDQLGVQREDTADLEPYEAAFAAVDAQPAELLVVVERAGRPIGTMQLTVLHGLSRGAVTRLQVEGVRVAADQRGRGVGEAMLAWAVDHARRHGCGLVQLTTDRARVDAHRFYERLGFEATHVGYKLSLAPDGRG